LIDYQFADWNLGGWNRYYTKYAAQNDVILVFPKGSRQYNWMTSNEGFFMIPEMLESIKKAVNVDDNKVFISGHSNGGTGRFHI
jgi:poly(3-hydroxybutyrate) depolymerase